MKKKLIPFSIEQAEAGAKVVTKSGLPVRIVDTNVANENPILGLIKIEGIERPYLWMQSGEFSKLSGAEGLDLFIEEEEIENQDEQKLSDKFEIMPDKWYVCTCSYTGEDFLFLLNFPYLGKDLLKCHLPEDKNYQDFLRPWTDQDANSNALASLVSYIDKNKDKKIKPKFKVGDVMRTLEEAKIDITEGLPVVVSIDDTQYHCTNETIDIKDQDEYEYPPMNAKYTHTHTIMLHRMTYRDLWWWLVVQRDYPDEKREYCYKSNSSYPLSPYEYSYKAEDADKEVEDILIRIDDGEWMEPLTDE